MILIRQDDNNCDFFGTQVTVSSNKHRIHCSFDSGMATCIEDLVKHFELVIRQLEHLNKSSRRRGGENLRATEQSRRLVREIVSILEPMTEDRVEGLLLTQRSIKET